ncbi:MAG TPA: type II and III secretion system protein family protein, partial [Caulobacteraceae bacterium]|nr:type II and III secretion system protein family protein [Caulobacteraceae bacterium]
KGIRGVDTNCFKANLRGALMAAVAGAVLAAAPLAAGPAMAQTTDSSATSELVVGLGKSQVLEIPAPYTDLMIADPKIADVLPLSNRSVYVVGKGVGSTALTIYGPGKRLVAAANIVVSADVDGLKSRLAELLPDEHDISVRPANQSLILSGTVSSAASLQRVLTLAETYAPGKVVNMLGVEGVQQVMLQVRFVEMSRSAAKNLGLNVNWNDPGTNNGILVTTGKSILGIGTPTSPLIAGFGGIKGTFGTSDGDLTLVVDALEDRGVVKTLAEPNLVAMSGDTASFLAGGEFPIPIAQASTGTANGGATITVAFKQFGIALAFTPTVLKDGLMNIVVNPEVSAIDKSNSVTSGGVTIPGLRVRRAHTTVELRDGESFVVAGLLSDDYQNTISQFPFLGDIPVLGALFRSTGYQRNETELVIVVTPHLVVPRKGRVALPSDHFIPPSDFELFLLGAQTGSGTYVRPEDRVLMGADPKKGGVEGPYGHVLY